MFSGFRDVDSASSCGASSSCSPTSLGSSSRSFGSNAKARLQDKQIEKGRAIMMRDYVSRAAKQSVHTTGTGPQGYQQCSTGTSQQFEQGKALMLRDYVSCASTASLHATCACLQGSQQCRQQFEQQVLEPPATFATCPIHRSPPTSTSCSMERVVWARR
jgi:hypothetical protein